MANSSWTAVQVDAAVNGRVTRAEFAVAFERAFASVSQGIFAARWAGMSPIDRQVVAVVARSTEPRPSGDIEAQRLGVKPGAARQSLRRLAARSMVASAVRMVIEQPDGMSAREQLDRVIDGLRPHFPAVASLLTSAEAGLLAHFDFPEPHRRQIRSTNPLERLNKEIPVLEWCLPEGPRRRLVRWMTVPGPDSKEISDATSIWWLSSV